MSKEGLLNNDRVAKAFKSLIIFPKATMLRKYMKFDQHHEISDNNHLLFRNGKDKGKS